MDTIINYLDNMFATLPKTKEVENLKQELLANMEDKYNELKGSGKTENEAIGVVISEFGNIDELIQELGIEIEVSDESNVPVLNELDVNQFLNVNEKVGKLIGVGVFLCMLGVSLLIFITQLVEEQVITGYSQDFLDMIGLIPLFVLIAIAVGLFIYSGTLGAKYNYLEQGFELQPKVRKEIVAKNEAYQSIFTSSLIFGVALCILSPIFLIVISTLYENAENYGVVLLLLMVASAVYLFIYFGKKKEGYSRLLQNRTIFETKREENRVIGAVASVVWPLAVAIFLITGLVFQQWHINWIVFPITGLLFAMFSGAYSILKGSNG